MPVSSKVADEPDLTLIAALMHEIKRNPPALEAKTLLVHHYISINWISAAANLVEELKRVAPDDLEITSLVEDVKQRHDSATVEDQKLTPIAPSASHKSSSKTAAACTSSSQTTSKNNLFGGSRTLRQNLKRAFDSILRSKSGLSARVRNIVNGRNETVTAPAIFPSKKKSVVRSIRSFPDKAIDIVIADLEDVFQSIRDEGNCDEDHIRDTLFNRMCTVKKMLPQNQGLHCEVGFMNIERDKLNRHYANDSTMLLLLPLDTIPRRDFYVTEDNHAWDISELCQAISVNGGVMRNPLTGNLFTSRDIRALLMSPHGTSLAALRVEQHELSQGVREQTIAKMERLSKTMLAEPGRDWKQSRAEIEEFQAYVATLPGSEQKTIHKYKCPKAFDGHTRKAYDDTVGQTLQDVQAGILCVHKGGDFMKQAAAHLRKNRAAVPKPLKAERGCVVM